MSLGELCGSEQCCGPELLAPLLPFLFLEGAICPQLKCRNDCQGGSQSCKQSRRSCLKPRRAAAGWEGQTRETSPLPGSFKIPRAPAVVQTPHPSGSAWNSDRLSVFAHQLYVQSCINPLI